jgi:hypothetical protein
MIIYNVTISVEESIVNNWLNWMKSEHIPDVLATGFFKKAQINRVVTQLDRNSTFAVAYTCNSMKDLHQYQIEFSAELQQKHSSRYGDKVVAFRTVMEVLEEF